MQHVSRGRHTRKESWTSVLHPLLHPHEAPRPLKSRRKIRIAILTASVAVAVVFFSLVSLGSVNVRFTIDSWGSSAVKAWMDDEASKKRVIHLRGWELKADGKLAVPYNENGRVSSTSAKTRIRHPMYELVERAEDKWKRMLRRQSNTLSEAVREYKHRYGRLPPAGFDKWFEFAKSRNVILIDEFDQINYDIEPFLTVPPSIMHSKLIALEDLSNAFHMKLQDTGEGNRVHLSGPSGKVGRAQEIGKLLEGFAHLLPKDLIIHASAHDTGSILFSEDIRQEARVLVAQGRYFSRDNLTFFENKFRNKRRTLTNSCVDDSPAVLQELTGASANSSVRTVEFIHDHRKTMDFCHNPSLLHNHGAFLWNEIRNSRVSPLFVFCKLHLGGELLMPALAGYRDRPKDVADWETRIDQKVFWRGSTTGSHFFKKNWRESHRIRLHTIANPRDNEANELITVLVENPDSSALEIKNYTSGELSKTYMDVGLVGPPKQCEQSDGACDEMEAEIKWKEVVKGDVGAQYKYVIDVDGNGWSQRFPKLLGSGSVVLKSTVFPEWNSGWLMPYYHYLPVQHDYSDLYNTLLFFAGPPGESGEGHDDLAKRISQHAVDFVKEHWRWEDMQAYMFRLLLEYARATSPDREAMMYKP